MTTRPKTKAFQQLHREMAKQPDQENQTMAEKAKIAVNMAAAVAQVLCAVLLAAAVPWIIGVESRLSSIDARLAGYEKLEAEIVELEKEIESVAKAQADHLVNPDIHHAKLRLLEQRIQVLERN